MEDLVHGMLELHGERDQPHNGIQFLYFGRNFGTFSPTVSHRRP